MSGGEVPSAPTGWPETVPSCDPSKGSPDPHTRSTDKDPDQPPPERRKLKCEDSSYDSDFDGCEPASTPPPHEDISRTVSETLAAEFDEYVTLPPTSSVSSGGTSVRGPSSVTVMSPSSVGTRTTPVLTLTEATPQPCLKAPGFPSSVSLPPTSSNTSTPVEGTLSSTAASEGGVDPPHSLASILASSEYPQQVEFGVRLGYSENLVQLALAKLGANPDKNKLLDELIHLGAGVPKPEVEAEPAAEAEESKEDNETKGLRPIVIDGSSVAISHGNKSTFSCRGIRLCVDWFKARGHTDIRVFVPMFRKEASRPDAAITDKDILSELEDEGVLTFTPSRTCSGKRIVAYDDRYILKEALTTGGVIVSNDNFRDLAMESHAFKKIVEENILMYSWVNGRFEPPDDPLGRNGPSLDVFLRKALLGAQSSKESRPCPYGRKCTYGNKCKYLHPERGTAPVKSVTERLQEQAQKHFQEKAKSRDSSPGESLRAKSLSLPVSSNESAPTKRPLTRTQSGVPSGFQSTPREVEISVAATTTSVTLQPPPLGPPLHSPSQPQRPFDPLRPAASLKGDPSLYEIHPSLSYSTPWSWGTQPLEGSSQQTSTFASMPLSKQCVDLDGENPHPKLQRQLSINPVADSRIPKRSTDYYGEDPNKVSEYSSMNLSLHHHHQQLHHQPMHQQLLQKHCLMENDPLGKRLGTRCISPGPGTQAFGYSNRDLLQTYHPPLTRHSSSQESKGIASYNQHILPYYHGHVTRNLSAPDPIWGGGSATGGGLHQGMRQHRLNSTSDSRLNLHGSCSDSTQHLTDPFEDSSSAQGSRLSSYTHRPLSGLGGTVPPPPGPGPVGSRPMSPQQPLTSVVHPSPHLPRRPFENQPQQPAQISTSGSNEDERLKIFYHLSHLFPEAQVRHALLSNPDETDATKICTSIIASMGTPRPLSPQQMASGSGCLQGSTLASAGGHLPLRGSTSLGSLLPSSVPEVNKEAVRLEAFARLSKVFPEDQVHTILMTYPEETDPAKLMSCLVALNKT